MLMESQVKFSSSQNICGAAQWNNVAALPWTTEVDVDEDVVEKHDICTLEAKSSSSTLFKCCVKGWK